MNHCSVDEPETWYATTFKVEGDLRFPLDMLRSDLCCPLHTFDAATIERTFSAPVFVELELLHLGSDPDWKPDRDRWTAYGWRLVEVGAACPA